ncbi:MAG: S41 family peptidase [Coriobacteriales bacterium]
MDEEKGTCPSPYVRIEDGSERREREKGLIIPFVLVAIVFFVLGIAVANSGSPWLPFNRAHVYEEGEQAPAHELSSRINEVARYLDASSIYGFDGAEATDGAIKALLSASEDEYAEYLDTDYYASFLKYTSGSYMGVGITITDIGSYAMVTGVYEDSPAAGAGVKPGYVAVSVDGEECQWTAQDLTKAIEREEGETVEITWLAPTDESLSELAEAYYADAADESGAEGGSAAASQIELEGELVTTEMEYANVTIPNVASEMRGDVGYVRLYSFNKEAGEAIDGAVRELTDKGAKALVLDLRDNGGGYVDQAVHIVSSFVEQGDVLQMRAKKKTITDSVTGKVVSDLPLVVLVNERSASASEIVAAALKDHDRATIVGATTYGKGTVQNYVKLSFGGAVKFTIAEYLSPDGNPINGVGVEPDIAVEAPEEFVLGMSEDDPQLDRALEEAEALASEGGGNGQE